MHILVFRTSIRRQESLEVFLGDCVSSRLLKLTNNQAESIQSVINAALENDRQENQEL